MTNKIYRVVTKTPAYGASSFAYVRAPDEKEVLRLIEESRCMGSGTKDDTKYGTNYHPWNPDNIMIEEITGNGPTGIIDSDTVG